MAVSMACFGLEDFDVGGYFLAEVKWHGEGLDELLYHITCLGAIGTADDELGEIGELVIIDSFGTDSICVDEDGIKDVVANLCNERLNRSILDPDNGLAVLIEAIDLFMGLCTGGDGRCSGGSCVLTDLLGLGT